VAAGVGQGEDGGRHGAEEGQPGQAGGGRQAEAQRLPGGEKNGDLRAGDGVVLWLEARLGDQNHEQTWHPAESVHPPP